MNDTIADMLARIQNAIMRKREEVLVPNTKMNAEILRVLKEEEMTGEYEINDREIKVELKYDDNEPVIRKLKKISKPGQRIYVTYKELKPVMNGRGIAIISTSEGILSGAMAKSRNLGGELICEVW
jgi:small subunit ribosomal protein S8